MKTPKLRRAREVACRRCKVKVTLYVKVFGYATEAVPVNWCLACVFEVGKAANG